MSKQPIVDWRWERAGKDLKFCDPMRYMAVLKLAEKIVSIYQSTTWDVLPPSIVPRNDNG